MKANEILETCLYVDDLDTARTFYQDVLGLELFEHQQGRHLFWRCGQRMLLLFRAEQCDVPDANLPRHGAHGAGHVAFAVPDADIPHWQQHLTRHGVAVEQVVQWPQGGRSVYFRDPAGNSLEVASPRIWGLREQTTMGAVVGTPHPGRAKL